MLSQKGCWTCKDRKVSCDRTSPSCLKCTKSKRACGGYGLRLTWPKQIRKGVQTKSTPFTDRFREDELHFVNVVPTDVRLHLASAGSETRVGQRMSKDQLTIGASRRIPMRTPSLPAADDEQLLQFFESTVVDMLPAPGLDRRKIGRYLSSKAQVNNDKSSTAVRHAMLALASYVRGEGQVQVEQFKQIALEQMYTHDDMTACEAGGHVAANMILCVLEMQQTGQGSSAWIGYVCSFKEVLHVFAKVGPCLEDDSSTVLAMAYYFDIMARFSIRHWRTEHVKAYAETLGFDGNGHEECYLQYLLARKSLVIDLPNIAICAHPVMRLLAETLVTILYSSNPRYKSTEYQDYLDSLRSRFATVTTTRHSDDGTIIDNLNEADSLLQLTRLASMIYLERVSRNFSGQSPQIQSWTNEGLSILARLDCYAHPLPLFIIGCETASDKDRTVILDLYARLQKKLYLPHLLQIKSLIETAWNQHDLQEDVELEYIAKINLVMSTRDIVPCFI